MKTASEVYVTLKTFPHYGENFVIVGSKDGKLIGRPLDCPHSVETIEIERKDI